MPDRELLPGLGAGPQTLLAPVPGVDEGVAQRPAGVRARPVQAPCDVEHPGPAGLIPPPATSCFLAQSGYSDSGVAQNLVPSTTPWAPSISAAATPRPSVIPPAASTGTGATASTTAGTSGSVDRRLPCPPASVPWATITSAPV